MGIKVSYYIQQESYPISNAYYCKGTPKLKSQSVQLIEVAAKTYYNALMGGRMAEDEYLDDMVPPASVLKADVYLTMLKNFLAEDDMGNQLYMQESCTLHSDPEWVKNIYNRILQRSTNAVRAIMDILYR